MPKLIKVSADEARSRSAPQIRVRGKHEAVVKAIKGPPSSWDPAKRTARFVMTSERVDRYGDVVKTNGIDMTDFVQNPVALLCHMSRDWPIGTWQNVSKVLAGQPARMEGDLSLLPPGGPIETIDQCAWMLSNGGIRAASIGFVPNWDDMEAMVDDDNMMTGLQFNSSELVECSVCCVPANPDALAKSADGDPRLAQELIEDVLDNWARTPEGLMLPRAEYEAKYFEVAGERTTIVYGKRNAGDVVEIFGLKATEKDGKTIYEPEPIQLKQGVPPPVNLAEQERTFTDSVVMRIANMFGLKPKMNEPALPSPEIPSAPALLSPEKSAEIMAGAAAVRERLKKYA